MNVQNDIFSDVFDGAIDQYAAENVNSLTEEEQTFQDDEQINPSLRNDIEKLLTNGSISTEVELAGHLFVLRTLSIGEELSIAEICKDYEGVYAEAKAIATATVAAAMESIDGRALLHNLGPDPKNNIRLKFQYIRNKWYWAIIEELYQHYTMLLNRQIDAFAELRGK